MVLYSSVHTLRHWLRWWLAIPPQQFTAGPVMSGVMKAQLILCTSYKCISVSPRYITPCQDFKLTNQIWIILKGSHFSTNPCCAKLSICCLSEGNVLKFKHEVSLL